MSAHDQSGRSRHIGVNPLAPRVTALEEAMGEFCDRVEKGEVRSRYTYEKFCQLLGRKPKGASYADLKLEVE